MSGVRQVLFVTRKFPPSVGGMENLAADLWSVISERRPESRLIAFGGSPRGSALWLPVGAARTAWSLLRHRPDAVVVGDGLMAIALRPVLWLRRTRRIAVVHGLDLTWRVPGYPRVIRWALRGWHRVAANSASTAELAAGVLGSADRVRLLPLGVRLPERERPRPQARAEIGARWDVRPDELVALTLGRLVERKGAAWFAEHVVPRVPGLRYLVAGSGPEESAIRAAAERAGVTDRVLLTGAVSDDDRELLMAGCDLFVQPNVAVAGDTEGFGLVVVEAAVRGAVVLAAGIEGLRDAVVDGSTGTLLPSADAQAWVDVIEGLRSPAARQELGDRNARAARERYGLARMGDRLDEILDEAAAPRSRR
jgi:phosphatidyl-myo-inositol dimannoside synthase